RPKEFIVIAISDPYTILLNTITGEVFVMTSESINGCTLNKFQLF
ncbi:hypothetical protein BDD30_2448, partial [Photorhabdus asymbiotica]